MNIEDTLISIKNNLELSDNLADFMASIIVNIILSFIRLF
jgi:hypothetical protein